MRHIQRTLATLGLVAGALSAHAAANVEVSFVKPDGFSDAHDANGRTDQNVKGLASYLEELGQRYLLPGELLTITVLDVDLAGEIRPRGARGDLRVLKGGVDWPRIKLRYSLQAGNQILGSGEESLADMNYMSGLQTGNTSDPLYHEKRMLNDWFISRFVKNKAAANH